MRVLNPIIGALALASVASAQIGSYSQDFEGLDMSSPSALSDDGWLVFGNAFDSGGGYLYGYGPFPAPNGGGGFCAVASGEGGPPQGAQQLVVFSDYNNMDQACCLIEANTFQERVIDASDVGKTYVFTFDAKLGDLQPNSTAAGFIKILDPSAGFALTVFEIADTTATPTTWTTYSLSTTIDASQIGDIFQIGFLATATQFTPSGVVYDNVNLGEESTCVDNNTCACAEPIAGNGTFSFDTTAATQDGPPDPACFKFGTSQIDCDVWYAWTPDDDCDYTIETCGGTLGDTKLAIYNTSDCGSLVGSIIDCNDDTCGLQSQIFAPGLSAGSTYLIRVGCFPGGLGTTGTFTISKSNCDTGPTDTCDNCTPITGTGLFDWDTSAASQDGPGDPACDKFGTDQIDNDVWFCYTAPCSGDYTFNTCDLTTVDTKLAIYGTDDCGALAGSILDCNDDTCGLQSQVSASLVGGQSYLVRVGTFPGAFGGPGQLRVDGPDTGATNYCEAGVNQDGEQTILKLTGSERVSDNNLEICANDVSSFSRFGLFVFGDQQQQTAFASGFLCVGLGGNFNRLNPILTYNMVNQVCRQIDLTAPPADIITPGSTWNFQFWYRDFGQTNLSDGLSICFSP